MRNIRRMQEGTYSMTWMIQVRQEDSRDKLCANNDAYNLCYDGEDV